MPDVFSIAPAPTRAWVMIAGFALLMAVLLVLFAFIGYSSRATRFRVGTAGLSVERTLYGRSFAWEQLRLDEARVVDLARDPELQPTRRTNGIGLPGYRAGWFRLRRAGRGLLFVTDPSRVVAIPTRDGFTLLLTAEDPAAFLRSLRDHAAAQ